MTIGQKASVASIKAPAAGGLEIKTVDKLKAIEMLIKQKNGGMDKIDVTTNGKAVVFAMCGDNGRGPTPDED
jgi:hypothetical protein